MSRQHNLGPIMIREARIAVLIAKAHEAEEEAEKAKDALIRDHWLRIAEHYRALAAMT